MFSESLKAGDYAVFAISLIVTVVVGIYFSLRGNKSGSDLILGGSNMNPVPVAISLAVTSLSAIFITELPKEVYQYGIMFWIATWSELVGGIVFAFIFVPAFYKSDVTTIYEFLEKRFQYFPLRVLCSVLSLLQLQFYMVLVFFTAAYVFKISVFAADQPLIYAGLILGAITTFYSALGGIKAVVIVDTIQYLIILAGVIGLFAVGVRNAGDSSSAFTALKEGGRLNLFDFTFDIWQPHTFWNLFLGSFFSIIATNMNQMTFQRLRSVASVKKAIIASLLFSLIKWILVSIVLFTGLAMFVNIANCTYKPIKPFGSMLVIGFVKFSFSSIPVMTGLLLAALIAGALSTLSSGINSMAAVVWYDFLCRWSRVSQFGSFGQLWTLRCLGIGFGLLTTVAGVNVSYNVRVLSFLIAVSGSLFGTMMGVIVLALYSKSARGLSVMIALLLSVSLTLWWSYGNSTYVQREIIPFNQTCEGNTTTLAQTVNKIPGSFIEENLYSISYQLFYPISCLLMLFLGQTFSWVEQLTVNQLENRKSKPAVSLRMDDLE